MVIGATGAFGSAAAQALSQLGCDLTIADMNGDKLEDLAGRLRAEGGTIATVDEIANSEAAAEKIVSSAVSAHDGLDLMFVATGLNDVGYIEEQSYDDWRAVMNANLDGYWLACQAAGRQFAKQPAGRGRSKVVVVSSTRVRHGLPTGYTGYCASKAGLDGMVRALACEWGAKGSISTRSDPRCFAPRSRNGCSPKRTRASPHAKPCSNGCPSDACRKPTI